MGGWECVSESWVLTSKKRKARGMIGGAQKKKKKKKKDREEEGAQRERGRAMRVV